MDPRTRSDEVLRLVRFIMVGGGFGVLVVVIAMFLKHT